MINYVSKEDLSKKIIPEVIKLKSFKAFPPKMSALNLMARIYPICSTKD